MPDTHMVMPGAYQERNAVRQYISSPSSNSRAGAPLLRNADTAAKDKYSSMASREPELLGAEDFFRDEGKPGLLEATVQEAGLQWTPDQSLSS